jgi:hypothetical protein
LLVGYKEEWMEVGSLKDDEEVVKQKESRRGRN